jgi:hypothetical protein
VIAIDSPAQSCESGLLGAPSEKKLKLNASAAASVPSLESRFEANSARNGHLSRISDEEKADFLCNPDCMAERAGFEPSVPICLVQEPTFA